MVQKGKLIIMNRKVLFLCDTMPTNPWTRDRLPAIVSAAKGKNILIRDIYEFKSVKEAHYIHSIKGYSYFAKHNLIKINKLFLKKVLSHQCKILILGKTPLRVVII